jgi:hypothetical protein
MTNVSALCEDLVDDDKDISDVDDLIGNHLPPIKEKKVRQRQVYDPSNIRRRNRKRVKKKIKMQNLKGMIWNGGGFGDTAKHLFVKESIMEHALDFIALLETVRSNFANPFLNQLAGPFNFSWFCLPP